jgi:hypothetical protein
MSMTVTSRERSLFARSSSAAQTLVEVSPADLSMLSNAAELSVAPESALR